MQQPKDLLHIAAYPLGKFSSMSALFLSLSLPLSLSLSSLLCYFARVKQS